jgi:hypothetical protein
MAGGTTTVLSSCIREGSESVVGFFLMGGCVSNSVIGIVENASSLPIWRYLYYNLFTIIKAFSNLSLCL